MKGGDPRTKGGGGILPLQATAQRWDIDKRPAILAYRLVDRQDGQNQLGHFVYEEESVGDVLGGQLWLKASREIPMWRFATPVRIDSGGVGQTIATSSGGAGASGLPSFIAPETGAAFGPVMGGDSGATLIDPGIGRAIGGGNGTADDGSRQDVATGGKTDSCAVYTGPLYMRSLYDRSYGPDTRLSVLRSEWNPNWPKFPKGFYGISLTGNKETSQEDLFFPCDPRLIAVNRAGDSAMGSLVCDMKPGFEIDTTRQARLQSMMWVIKEPRYLAGGFAPPRNTLWFGNRNAIAWNVGPSGCQEAYGGFVIDEAGTAGGIDFTRVEFGSTRSAIGDLQQSWGARPKVIAAVSSWYGGFLDVGSPSDKHALGSDADGHRINSAHLSLGTLFRLDDVVDGPLHWTGYWEGITSPPGPRRTIVHFEFHPDGAGFIDPSSAIGGNTEGGIGGPGRYKWHSYCETYTPTGDGGGGGGG